MIAGPPGAGKTTHVQEHATPGDLIWDWDHVMAAISGDTMHTHHHQLVPYIAEARDAIIRTLRQQRPNSPARAWIITTDATHEERQRWQPWDVTTLATPLPTLLDRLTHRDPSVIEAARDWWNRYEPAA